MGLRKYNKKRRPQSLEEHEDYVGRKYTLWIFVISLVGYIIYKIFS